MGLVFDRRSRVQRRGRRTASVAAAIVAAFAIALPALAAAPNPAPGVATVDGNPSEWGAGDFFSAMKGGDGTTWGSLSLRYDCTTHVLTALVAAVEGVAYRADRPENAYLRIDGVGKLVSGESGNDGTPPDFAWVGLDGIAAVGYEASGVVAPGDHSIRAHVLMFDGSADGYRSLDSDPRTGPLTLSCDDEEPASSASATPTPTGQVEAATGVPITPPPTDTSGSSTGSWTLSGLLLIIAGLAVIDIAAMRAVKARTR